MTSEERLEIYDKFILAKEELTEVRESLPYNRGDIEIICDRLEELEKRIYLWWRTGE